MSTNVLIIIPQDPNFLPFNGILERVVAELVRYLSKPKDDFRITITDRVRFIDPGFNLRQIRCPFCNNIIDSTWWQNTMDQAYEGNFSNLKIITPCCQMVTSLNNLYYDWTAGFARSSIEVFDPKGDITQEQQKVIETILGIEIRKIWSHF